jgi:hypothetical protein
MHVGSEQSRMAHGGMVVVVVVVVVVPPVPVVEDIVPDMETVPLDPWLELPPVSSYT